MNSTVLVTGGSGFVGSHVLLRVRAARDASVKRVVFTSTCGAVYYGQPLPSSPPRTAS
jgi:nucleoside-diphosphate-sugar epimerase